MKSMISQVLSISIVLEEVPRGYDYIGIHFIGGDVPKVNQEISVVVGVKDYK